MTRDNSFSAVMARKGEIIRSAVGVDYRAFESGSIAFDYEAMMASTGYTLEDVAEIQRGYAIGNTPLMELKNITALTRRMSRPGYGARIFVKDEAANPSGSFKVRRAATSIHHAKRMGYPGALTATSGNYGAAVASCCAKSGLPCIIVQECYDSHGVGQPEIIEKARKCEALGAEVVQLTVGPELFYTVLRMLEDTGYFNASLYTAFGIAGIETLGYEIATQCREQLGKDPDVVVCTNAGGGNLTGTARGIIKANCNAQVVAASVNLKGLHMASDTQFNKKSFTTGHTGFGMPFSTWPDRSDVPRSAARPLRYMDRYVTVHQGEVFYTTELMARLEGIERGPAGNTSLAAAISLAQELPEDAIIVVQETEYTGAGKHANAQLSFARQNGIQVRLGDPADEVPGESIVLPAHPSLLRAAEVDVDHMRRSLITHAASTINHAPTEEDIVFLADETKTSELFVRGALAQA
ncbi:2-amino-4-ketopentanoate thiolase beta subunit [bioreactor metagenome]|uniref:2-amino-4-ketopentanoate thiolase beta subunit n=1 Tax=bioreactor metagenome TaxID=1076179 RepID=A0A644YFC0_9ZZZZ